ncbi:MAG: hypothetical protein U0165_08895 [Polyangiaceae bacterium]
MRRTIASTSPTDGLCAADAETRIREGIQQQRAATAGHGRRRWPLLKDLRQAEDGEDDALVELEQCRTIARSVHFKLLEDDCTAAINDIQSRESQHARALTCGRLEHQASTI